MPIYEGAPVDDEAEIVLARWSIRQTASGDRHFVGFNVLAQDGRVSTAIVAFDAATRTGITKSGRRYVLSGRAGFDRDAEYVWGVVVRAREIHSWTDVTEQLVPDLRMVLSAAERETSEKSSSTDSTQIQDVPEVSLEHREQESLAAEPCAAPDDYFEFRASAHEGEFAGPDTLTPPIYEITGQGWVGYEESGSSDVDMQFLFLVRALTLLYSGREESTGNISRFKGPAMNMHIYRLDDQSGAANLIVRFDMGLDANGMHVKVHVVGHPAFDLRTFQVDETDSVWEIVSRCLP
ncbi:MAG: hypothetical protein WCA85_14535 [Paraburkholderia sp.]|uniref:hypothetical protein n=1 Tax=Paraburkholderia sp. TaxID=1926495 RepID=UPI003C640277